LTKYPTKAIIFPEEYNKANLKGLPATALKNDPNDII